METDHTDEKIKEYKERFNRWHLKQVDLLTFLINFLFTVSIAISGFIVASQDKPYFKCKTIPGDYSLSRTVLLILSFSVTVGVVALITRLEDFRRTKEIPKLHRKIYESKKANSSEHVINNFRANRDKARRQTENLGVATWILFYCQLAFFIIALWAVVIFA